MGFESTKHLTGAGAEDFEANAWRQTLCALSALQTLEGESKFVKWGVLFTKWYGF